MTTMAAPTSTTAGTQFATSADGTSIAYEVHGAGPALVFVDGAMCQRTMGPSADLARALAPHFAVHDRRGRGESGAGESPWSVDREIEDLEAVVAAAGGEAHVLALSSGAALALEAAERGVPITRLALYEAPFIVDDSREPHRPDAPEHVQGLVDCGERGEAVKTFMRMVGVPAPFVGVMRVLPAWKKMTGIAPHAPVRPRDRRPAAAGRAAARGPLRRRAAADARHRGRQEPRLHAARAGRDRRRRPGRPARDASRADPHGQGQGHRPGRGRLPPGLIPTGAWR
jgi:hypothetical protein